MELLEKKQTKIYFIMVMLVIVTELVLGRPLGPLFFSMDARHVKEKNVLKDSLALGDVFLMTSEQIYNHSLKKSQKKSRLMFSFNKKEGFRPGVDYEITKDDSKLYNELDGRKASFFIESGVDLFLRNLNVDMKNGYVSEHHEYATREKSEEIENNGLFHESKVAADYRSNMTLMETKLYDLTRTPFWSGRLTNRFQKNYKKIQLRAKAAVSRAKHIYPQEDFDEKKVTLTRFFGGEAILFPVENHTISGEVVLDSLEKNSYEGKTKGVYRERKNSFFKDKIQWEYLIHENFISDLSYSFLKDKVDFKNKFNSYLYKNYFGKFSLKWNYHKHSVEFSKIMEKDYFHYHDSLNFNDNDLLRDYTRISVVSDSIFGKNKLSLGLMNQKKKMVYVSKYLSANNYFEDNYKVLIELTSSLSNSITITNGIRLEADYLFYEYDESQNSLLRIFEHEFLISWKFLSIYRVEVANQIRERDNGPYEEESSNYLYYMERKRIRQLLNWKLFRTGKWLDISLHVLYAKNIYYVFEELGLEKEKKYNEFSGGGTFKTRKNDEFPYELSVNLERKHFYGYRYWVARFNFNYYFN